SSGFQAWWFTVKVATRPRPLVGSGATFIDPQRGHIGAGGWKKRLHAPQRWIISRPASPPCQKADESLVI
ncbi:MAG: hypothetical protein U1C47_01950, partial [Hydrogenophaga sp.]|nr:hypothetical protein [Hydrogenophaga sp.]